jgi:hypothetical protein
MNEQIPSHEFSQKVAVAASAPEPSEKFLKELRLRVENRVGERQRTAQKNRRMAWSLSLAAFLVVGSAVLIAGPANVVAAMREALGYIPGFGVVHTTGLRMLAEPVIATRDGITITLKSVIADSIQTSVSYEVTGLNLPQVDPETTPDPNACSSRPLLRLPNGQEMQSLGGGGGMSTDNFYDGGDQFPPLPESVEDATLVFPCLLGMLPGTAPENWGVSFHLVRNPTAPAVFPVQQIDTPSSEGTGTPSSDSEKDIFLQQISLKIDSIAEGEDGFIIMGTVETNSDQYTIDPFFPPGAIAIKDSTGAEIPAEMASVGNDDLAIHENQPMPAKWAYKVQGKYFHGPLTLSLKWVTISPKDPITFSVDVGSHPQKDQTWTLDRQLKIFGSVVLVQSVMYVVREDMGPQRMQGLEFTVRLPDVFEGIQLNYWDPNPQPGSEDVFTSLSDGFKHGKDTIQVDFLTTLPLSDIVVVTANVIYVDGPWTAIWNPPTVEGAPSPTPIPQACLTNESWETIQNVPVPSLPPM